jgi:hypothetical protein
MRLFKEKPGARCAIVCFSSSGEAKHYVSWAKKYPTFINHRRVYVNMSDTQKFPHKLGIECTRVLVVAPGSRAEKLCRKTVDTVIAKSNPLWKAEIESYSLAPDGTTTIVFTDLRVSSDARCALLAKGLAVNFGRDPCSEALPMHRFFRFVGSKLEKT